MVDATHTSVSPMRNVFVAPPCPHAGITALMLASKKGHTDIVNALLENGADVDDENVYGY